MELHGYTQNGSIEATIGGLRMTVPDDMSNGHRQMILYQWEFDAEGNRQNTIPLYVPAEPSNLLDQPISRLKFWLAAADVQVSKWSIRDRIAAMPETTIEERRAKAEAIAWFEDADVYRRNDPLLIRFAAEEGISEQELDALWIWTVQSAAPVPQQPA